MRELFVKSFCLLPTILFIVLPACDSSIDKDGVPKVDIHGEIVITTPAAIVNGWHVPEQRVRLISVGDKKIPLSEFLLTYCLGKDKNETCARGERISHVDFARGPTAELPKGL